MAIQANTYKKVKIQKPKWKPIITNKEARKILGKTMSDGLDDDTLTGVIIELEKIALILAKNPISDIMSNQVPKKERSQQ